MRRHMSARRASAGAIALALGLGALPVAVVAGTSASAITTPVGADSASWNINDARRPGIDTGSIRNISNSNVEAFGSIFAQVSGGEEPRMNGQMLRGFGLTATSGTTYTSSASVRLGDILVTRKLSLDTTTNIATFFDTFTNTATADRVVDVSFGGALGYGTANSAASILATSSGDQVIDGTDSWTLSQAAGGSNRRAVGVVVGDAGSDRVGNQQRDPFTTDYVTTGSAANYPGFVESLDIAPGETQSLLRYVVVGDRNDTTTIAANTAALAASPVVSALTLDELCTVSNWDVTALLGATGCAGTEPLVLPPAEDEAPAVTDVAYDVTGKTITELQAAMRAGEVTSVEITQAYLDRINAYDTGSLGFKAFISVADNAIEQAEAADVARKNGADSDLLGIPIALKDLYDTKDQITTGGTRALKDWQPATDAFQVAALRDAGAVLIGKTNLSEFANSGSFSESGFQQTWNGLYPSKSSFGSSGGSATALAADFAAGAMGSQTGVSLYAPSTGASIAAFRGTDGLTSTSGVMPLTWAQDYAGPMAKSVSDLAVLLDATATQETGNNPDDILTSRVDNSKRPTEWKTALDSGALQGKRIGYSPTAFQSAIFTDDTTGPETFEAIQEIFEAAGATLVPMTGAPSTSGTGINPVGSGGAEGWERYIEENPGFPFATPKGLLESKDNLPYNVSSNYTSVGMDDANTDLYLQRRDVYKERVADWMDTGAADTEPVDAVVYPGFISEVGNNDASSAALSSDRATGVLTSNFGVPTVILPITTTSAGYSNSVQIVGRAWDDASILGYGYAAEQQSKAALHTQYAPALQYSGPADSIVSLSLSSTSTAFGTPAKATIKVVSARTATGNVTVNVDGASVTGALVNGEATVTLPSTLTVGTHLVEASYAGTQKVAAGSAAAQLAVTASDSSIAISAAKSSLTYGTAASVTLAATTASGKPLAGTAIVYDGAKVITEVTIPATGKATLKVPGLTVGKHSLTARLLPGASNGAARTATSAVVTVAKAAAKVTLKVAKKTTTKKRLKATITVKASGLKTVTGKVTVRVNGKKVKTVALKNGKISVKLPKLKKGKAKVRVTYAGSATTKVAKSAIKKVAVKK
ncbi:amidase family protein [Rarobacter incanus]|nr:amidase family protein [Rarobacter incanus]